MHSARIEPTRLILVGTRITYQVTGDLGDLNSQECCKSRTRNKERRSYMNDMLTFDDLCLIFALDVKMC